ncbi:hypothetical protein Tco_0262047 [Tanacetum coccineum]
MRRVLENIYGLLVDGVLASGVVMIFEMDIASYAIQGTEILSLMIQLRILSIILLIFSYPPPQPQYVPYSCELCGNDAHHGYDCPLQVPFVYNQDPCFNQDFDYFPETSPTQYQPKGILELFRKLHNDVQNIQEELAEYINTPNWNRPTVYYDDDDDEDYTVARYHRTGIGDVIKSSVEILVPIPSESEISFSIDDIDYVEASPPDSELVSLEVVEIVIPKVRGIDIDILQTIKDDILREKLLNVNLFIAKIEALKDNPTSSSNFVTKSSFTFPNSFLEETNTFDNSIPESETFCFNLEENSSGSTTTRFDYSLPDYEAFYLDDDHVEEKSSGSTTTHADFSQYDSFIFDLSINPFPPADRSDCYHEELAGELAHIIYPPEYDCFYFKNEPDQGNFTMDVVEDIFDNPTREQFYFSTLFHVPNVLPTHPTLHLDSDFTLSSDSLGSDLAVSFPSGTRNKIFDPGIFIGVQSMIFLSPDEFSFSFIRYPPLPVIDTLLPFSSENENKVVNTGILASEEKSPPSSSHRGFKASKLSHHKSLMLIHGDNTPNLSVRHSHFCPP